MKEEDSHLVAAGSLHIHFTFSGHQIIYFERGWRKRLGGHQIITNLWKNYQRFGGRQLCLFYRELVA